MVRPWYVRGVVRPASVRLRLGWSEWAIVAVSDWSDVGGRSGGGEGGRMRKSQRSCTTGVVGSGEGVMAMFRPGALVGVVGDGGVRNVAGRRARMASSVRRAVLEWGWKRSVCAWGSRSAGSKKW
jgi:hypothetical protein